MSAYEDMITSVASDSGLAVDDGAVVLLGRHLELVYTANSHFNLTRIPSEDSVRLHVIDSLTAAVLLEGSPPGRFADLGSGAGFPGIPLAVVTGRSVALVESSKKKAAFLQQTVAELRLDSTVHPVRAEELAVSDAAAFSAVTARAVASLPSLVELSAPLLVQGGLLIALKAVLETEELERARRAARLCGMVEDRLVPARIAGCDAVRTLVSYRRVGPGTVALPRRPGMAQRRPLA